MKKNHKKLLTGLAIIIIPGAGIVYGGMLIYKTINKSKESKNGNKKSNNSSS